MDALILSMDEILFLFVGQYLEHLQGYKEWVESKKQSIWGLELSSSNMYGTSTNDCLQRQIQYQNTRIVCTKKSFFFFSVAKIDPVHLKFFRWVPSLPDNVVINGFLPIIFFSEFFCKKYNLESCREETGTSETNAKIGLCCFVIQELPKCLQGKKKRSV